jgi:hypothetical protein
MWAVGCGLGSQLSQHQHLALGKLQSAAPAVPVPGSWQAPAPGSRLQLQGGALEPTWVLFVFVERHGPCDQAWCSAGCVMCYMAMVDGGYGHGHGARRLCRGPESSILSKPGARVLNAPLSLPPPLCP